MHPKILRSPTAKREIPSQLTILSKEKIFSNFNWEHSKNEWNFVSLFFTILQTGVLNRAYLTYLTKQPEPTTVQIYATAQTGYREPAKENPEIPFACSNAMKLRSLQVLKINFQQTA